MPATATPGILSGLPSLDELSPLIGAVGVDLPNAPGADQGKEAGKGLLDLKQKMGQPGAGPSVPALSGVPSSSGFRDALNGPLSALTSVDGASLRNSLKAPLPVQMDSVPDLNSVAGQITSKVLPARAIPQPIEVGNLRLAGLDDFTGPVRRLAEAGAATPLRLLQVILKVLEHLVETATNVDNLKRFTNEALQDILIAQADELSDLLPTTGLTRAAAALEARDFLGAYAQLLDSIQELDKATGQQLVDAVAAARAEVVLPLRHFDRAATALRYLSQDDVAAIQAAVQELRQFPNDGKPPFLQETFDQFGVKVEAVLGEIAGPVNELKQMIAELRQFLEGAVQQAGTAAERVTDTLKSTLEKVGTQLDAADAKIREIAAKIQEFLQKVEDSIAPAMQAFEKGCATVVQAVDGAFTQVEEIREKLIQTVKDLEGQVDSKLKPALEQVRDKLDQFLGDIVRMLDQPEVKDVLDQAREGIEKLTTAINDASLSGVFDLVVEKTQDLDTRVSQLDVSRLGTPQKTALKVGVKVIEAVKVDEIIRPELEDAFAQILEPLRELIKLLRDNVLVIEREIDRFNPGSLITAQLEPHLAPIFAQLEKLKPSVLLSPIKDAIQELTGVLEQLDPQRLLDEVQKAYSQVYELVESLEPSGLKQLIDTAANRAIRQLEGVENGIDDLMQNLQESISLERLLQGTGIQEIADQEFWDLLERALGGEHLNRISQAVAQVEAELAAQFGASSYQRAAQRLEELAAEVDAQLAVTATAFKKRCGELAALVAPREAEIAALEERRIALLATPPKAPELRKLLEDMELRSLQELQQMLSLLSGSAISTPLQNLKRELGPAQEQLATMTAEAISQAAPAIFRAQISEPVNALVARIQTALQPFAELIPQIREFVAWLTEELPAELDRIVGEVIGALRQSVAEVLGRVIQTIRTARDAVTGTIDDVYQEVLSITGRINPGVLLNRFGEADFQLEKGGDEAFARLYALALRVVKPEQDAVAALLREALARDEAQLALLESLTGSDAGSSQAASNPQSGGSSGGGGGGGGGVATAQTLKIPAVYGLPRLTPDQKATLATGVTDALNRGLTDARLADLASAAKTRVAQDAAALATALEKATASERVAIRKKVIRNAALKRQLEQAQTAYAAAPADASRVRLNRVILEIHYPDALPMALQGIHAFLVEQVAGLYPEEAVQALDSAHAKILGILRGLPKQMIQEPLDKAFDDVRKKLHETFDLQKLFGALDGRVGKMEGELSDGLVRLSAAYNGLLQTLDTRLSG